MITFIRNAFKKIILTIQIKKKFKRINNNFLKIILQPGMFQVIFGLIIVCAFLFISYYANDYEELITKKRDSPLRLKFVNEPPGIIFFQKFLSSGHNNKTNTKMGNSRFQLTLKETNENFHRFHLLGTDTQGNDILVNIMKGAKTALLGSLIAICISLFIGLPSGILAGYFGGKFKKLSEYISSLIGTLPKLIFLIIIIATLGYNFIVIMATIGFLASTKIKEIIENKILILKKNQFIEAARELGVSNLKIIFKHILWHNCKLAIFIQITYDVAEVILLEASLSYIGYGVEDQISWRGMLSEGMTYIYNQQYWMIFFPAIAIIISILAFMFIADGVQKWISYREGQVY